MKIKKLEIHNIASIENAFIDFDQEPLSGTDLFLITGSTGSGKTTILDAISLALYNTTPRISKGGSDKEQANSDNLTGKDPRNIMRSNTGYAYVKLYFTGNDGRDYSAEWSVQRGKHKSPDKKLNNAVWSVTEIASGNCIRGDKKDGYAEVGAAIYAAVGLDFSQFCRTTMLAQGEFTEFLKSDEKDKAAILEKISGTDIYRKIGQEIFRQQQKAEANFKKEQDCHDAIEVMKPEERQEKTDMIAQLDKMLQEKQNRFNDIIVLIEWLNKDASSSQFLETARTKLEIADKAVNTEEFVQDQKLVHEWNETAEVRENYKEALASQARKEEAERALATLQIEFGKALSGEAYMVAQKQRYAEMKHDAQGAIHAEQANIAAYKNEQSIRADINNFTDKQVELQAAQKSLNECVDVKRPAAQKKSDESLKTAEAMKKEVDQAKTALDATQSRLAEIGLPALRTQKETLGKVETIKANIEVCQANIDKAQGAINEMKAGLPEAQKTAEEENKELERLKEEHDRRHKTIEEATLVMRNLLQERLGQEDNICPVCGQHVATIKADEVFAQEYAKIKAEQEAQATKATKANEALMRLNSNIASEEKVLKRTENELAEFSKALSTIEVDESVKTCSKAEISAKIADVAEQIAKAEEVEKTLGVLQKNYTGLLNAYSDAKSLAEKDSNAVKLIDQQIEGYKKVIVECKEKIAQCKEAITTALEGSCGWENNWEESPKAFAEELQAKARKYEKAVAAEASAEAGLAGIAPVLSNIATIKDGIMASMPHWSAENIQAKEVPGIQDVWVKLSNSVEAQKMALQNASSSYQANMAVVSEFLEAHPEYNLEKFDSLNKVSLAAKEAIAKKMADLVRDRATAQAQYDAALQQRDEHLAKQPSGIIEGIDVDTLTLEKDSITEERDRMNKEKGQLAKEIEIDDIKLATKQDTTLLDQLKAEKEKWDRFCKKYGDKEGNNLCMIAQSYVLGSLLKTANYHLQSMAPRYKLLVNAGTLNLKLEDQQNCYATRNTNSISGGESFLMSLALALALADFGQHLGVSTLFIDEGFGTLSGEALQSALNTLKAIHSDAGRQVGIISHREEIRENIPVQIRVNTIAGTSASEISVIG